MLSQHAGDLHAHHIPQNAAAHAGNDTQENRHKGVVAVTGGEAGFRTHHGEDAKTHRVTDDEQAGVETFVFNLAGDHLHPQDKQRDGHHRHHTQIGKAIEHPGREIAQQHITDGTAPQSGTGGQYQHAENIQLPVDAGHGAGQGKGCGADEFGDQ